MHFWSTKRIFVLWWRIIWNQFQANLFFLEVVSPFSGEVTAPSRPCDRSISTSIYKTYFACPKNEVPRKKRHPDIVSCGYPNSSWFSKVAQTRLLDSVSWFVLPPASMQSCLGSAHLNIPVQMPLKSFNCLVRYTGIGPFVMRHNMRNVNRASRPQH